MFAQHERALAAEADPLVVVCRVPLLWREKECPVLHLTTRAVKKGYRFRNMVAAVVTSVFSGGLAGFAYLPGACWVRDMDGPVRRGPNSSQAQHPVFVVVSAEVEFVEFPCLAKEAYECAGCATKSKDVVGVKL